MTINVEKQITYWKNSAQEDWQDQIEGRYPDMLPKAPDIDTARQELRQAYEVYQWLNQQLSM